MIVKNEESVIVKCLKSISGIPDEIIIVDTGSTDKTKSLVKKYADKLIDFQWDDDFSKARNFCEEHASYEYIMTWDADWILSDSGRDFLLKLKKKKLNKLDLIDGKWIIESTQDGSEIKTTHRVVFYMNNKFHWEYPIHEKLKPNKKGNNKGEYFPEIEIYHLKDPKEKQHRYTQSDQIVEKLIKNNNCPPHILFAYGENLLFQKRYQDSEVIFKKYLDEHQKKDETTSIMAIERLMQIYLETDKIKDLDILISEYKGEYKNNPRFILINADSIAVSNLLAADRYYENYLKNPLDPNSTDRLYDKERFEIHPMLMLANIYYVSNQESEALKLLRKVIKNTKIDSTREKAQLIINEISSE